MVCTAGISYCECQSRVPAAIFIGRGRVHAKLGHPLDNSPPVSHDPGGPEVGGVILGDPTSTRASLYFFGNFLVRNGLGRVVRATLTRYERRT